MVIVQADTKVGCEQPIEQLTDLFVIFQDGEVKRTRQPDLQSKTGRGKRFPSHHPEGLREL